METKEPKSWAEAMLKHVREEQQKQLIRSSEPEPEHTITIAQLIQILAIIGNYDVDIKSR